MYKKLVVLTGMVVSLAFSQVSSAQAPTCADLNWSAEILAANPDIARVCRGVYEKDGRMFAKATIEVVRVRGTRITFRPVYTDGSLGSSRSMAVNSSWRANIAGRNFRAGELMRGQQLNVYLPDDRWAIAVEDQDGPDPAEIVAIEEVAEVEMPTTASPLFLIGLAGGVFLAMGGLLSGLRRRLS